MCGPAGVGGGCIWFRTPAWGQKLAMRPPAQKDSSPGGKQGHWPQSGCSGNTKAAAGPSESLPLLAVEAGQRRVLPVSFPTPSLPSSLRRLSQVNRCVLQLKGALETLGELRPG